MNDNFNNPFKDKLKNIKVPEKKSEKENQGLPQDLIDDFFKVLYSSKRSFVQIRELNENVHKDLSRILLRQHLPQKTIDEIEQIEKKYSIDWYDEIWQEFINDCEFDYDSGTITVHMNFSSADSNRGIKVPEIQKNIVLKPSENTIEEYRRLEAEKKAKEKDEKKIQEIKTIKFIPVLENFNKNHPNTKITKENWDDIKEALRFFTNDIINDFVDGDKYALLEENDQVIRILLFEEGRIADIREWKKIGKSEN